MTSQQPTGLEIALQWAKLPPEHLSAALTALEPELAREHQYRMALLRAETQRLRDRRALVRHLAGLAAGFVIAVAMLVGAVVLGVNGETWLAAAFTGPSVFALVKIFVLRQATAEDLKQLRQARPVPQLATAAPDAGLNDPPQR